MNSSMSRILGLSLGLTAGLAALFFIGERMFWRPYKDASNRLALVTEEVRDRENKLELLNLEKLDLATRWYKLSLPENPGRAAADYGKMLKPLLRDCGLTVDDFQGPPPQEVQAVGAQKKAKHIILPFQVRAKGTVAALATTLEALQRMPLMHRVKSMVVDRVDAKDKTAKLNIQMTIEAMIVAGAKNQPKMDVESLMPASTSRMYNEVAMRNPFLGALPEPPPPKPEVVEPPPPEPPSGPDPREFIRIDTITPLGKEAFLRNYLYKIPLIRLRSTPMSGYDTFRITDEERVRTYVKGKVLRIDERDVYFQVGEDVYAFHFGQTMAEAMRRPLTVEDLDRLELTSLVDAQFAESEKTSKTAPAGKTGATGKTTKKR